MSFRDSSDSCMAPVGGHFLGGRGSMSVSPRSSARRRRLMVGASMSVVVVGDSGAGRGMCGDVGAKGA